VREEKIDYLLAGTAMFVAFVLLYSFRYFDDNTLTSWYWVFQTEGVDVKSVAGGGTLGIIAAYILSGLKPPEKRLRALLFLSSYAVGAYFWPSPEAIVDASRYFTYAKDTAQYGVFYFLKEWGGEINPWTDLPAVPFLYGVVFKVLGETRIYLQILNTLLFSATVVLTYSVGRRLWSKSVGFNAALLLLSMPYLYTQIPLILIDIPTMFILLLATYFTLEALEKRSLTLSVLASFGIFLSFYSKFSTWAMLSIIPIIFLSKRVPGSRRPIVVTSITSLALIAVAFYFKSNIIMKQLEILRYYQRPMLEVWGESHLSTFFYQIHPVVTLGAIYSLYLFYRRRDLHYVIVAWLPVLVLLLDVKRTRYLIPVFPMFALMAAYGLQSIQDDRLRKFVVYSAAAFSITVAAFAYLPFLEGLSATNLKEAGESMNPLMEDRAIVYTIPPEGNRYNPAVAVPIFDLFTQKNIVYASERVAPPHGAERSPLRFTWEYTIPDYYQQNFASKEKKPAVVVISQNLGPLPPQIRAKLDAEGYRLYNEFYKKSRRPYLYRTMVRIYRWVDGKD
jgi:hypothetical protein